MMDYLTDVDSKVKLAISDYLPQRKDQIRTLDCGCQNHTQAGTWEKHYGDHEFAVDTETLVTEDYNVVFEVPFAEVPSVAISLKGWDVGQAHPAIRVLVTDVTQGSFTFRAFGYPHTAIKWLEVAWMATISSRSGVWVGGYGINYKDDPEWAAKYQGTTERIMNVQAVHPVALENPGMVIGITGFNFDGLADGRLAVENTKIDGKGGNLEFKTWWNTTLFEAYVTTLHYSKNDKFAASVDKSTVEGGSLWNAIGQRMEEDKVLTNSFPPSPVLWYGMKKIDFLKGSDYIVQMDTAWESHYGDNYLDVKFTTWENSYIWNLIGSIFYTNSREIKESPI
jgi:hypothetical protein